MNLDKINIIVAHISYWSESQQNFHTKTVWLRTEFNFVWIWAISIYIRYTVNWVPFSVNISSTNSNSNSNRRSGNNKISKEWAPICGIVTANSISIYLLTKLACILVDLESKSKSEFGDIVLRNHAATKVARHRHPHHHHRCRHIAVALATKKCWNKK